MATRDEVLKTYAPRMLGYIEYVVALSSDEVDWCWESFASAREEMVRLLKDIDDACDRPRETD